MAGSRLAPQVVAAIAGPEEVGGADVDGDRRRDRALPDHLRDPAQRLRVARDLRCPAAVVRHERVKARRLEAVPDRRVDRPDVFERRAERMRLDRHRQDVAGAIAGLAVEGAIEPSVGIGVRNHQHFAVGKGGAGDTAKTQHAPYDQRDNQEGNDPA